MDAIGIFQSSVHHKRVIQCPGKRVGGRIIEIISSSNLNLIIPYFNFNLFALKLDILGRKNYEKRKKDKGQRIKEPRHYVMFLLFL